MNTNEFMVDYNVSFEINYEIPKDELERFGRFLEHWAATRGTEAIEVKYEEEVVDTDEYVLINVFPELVVQENQTVDDILYSAIKD